VGLSLFTLNPVKLYIMFRRIFQNTNRFLLAHMIGDFLSGVVSAYDLHRRLSRSGFSDDECLDIIYRLEELRMGIDSVILSDWPYIK